MTRAPGSKSLFERLKLGLEEGIEFFEGKRNLRTRTMIAPPPLMQAKDIVALRRGLKMSRLEFSRLLNVSLKTVVGWEGGNRRPAAASLRLLQLVKKDPLPLLNMVKAS